MKHILRTLFFALPSAWSTCVCAQTHIDIALVPGQNNDIEVRGRTDADFDGVFAGLTFTVRWSSSSGADLGSVQQVAQMQDIIPIGHSGPEQVDGPYRYQIYVGFGFSAISDIPAVLQANTEFVLCNIPVLNATDVFSIVNDSWTQSNNGNFFASFNGTDATGVIYEVSTGIPQSPAAGAIFGVWPNPVVDDAVVTLNLGNANNAELDLVDAAGKQVWQHHLLNVYGLVREPMDLSHVDAGVYLLRLRAEKDMRTLRVVKK